MKVVVKSAWGSDHPTKAAFPFLHTNALAEAGHEAHPRWRSAYPFTSEAPARGPGESSTRTPRERRHPAPTRPFSFSSSSGRTSC